MEAVKLDSQGASYQDRSANAINRGLMSLIAVSTSGNLRVSIEARVPVKKSKKIQYCLVRYTGNYNLEQVIFNSINSSFEFACIVFVCC